MNYTDAVGACEREGARLPTFRTEQEWLAMQDVYLQGENGLFGKNGVAIIAIFIE